MFGYVQVNGEALSDEEKARYRSVYCGLCHTLGKRHGFHTRMSLNYDLTFLALLLSSLYEPSETTGKRRCIVHPFKKHDYAVNPYTDYAADMTVALVYYKCLDDWNDEKRIFRRLYASVLSKSYKKVKAQWSEQCEAIERELEIISKIESDPSASPDAAANSFGRLMAALFVPEKDCWEPYLKAIGYGIGRFIYFADAAVDLPEDRKKDNYNPLKLLNVTPEEMRPHLKLLLGEASKAFERLPLIQDVEILRNILYSGIWIKYNQGIETERKKTKHGK